MKTSFKSILEDTPIIASIKDDAGLEKCLMTDIKVVFILYGDICNIGEIVKKIKKAGKVAMVHLDLIGGMSAREVALDYLKKNTEADGIITTKGNLIKYARQLGFYTILRFFAMDSMAISNIEKQLASTDPDVIEVLPGVMPKVIKKISKLSRVPVIAGGLILDKEDVVTALDNGAISVSATGFDVWKC